MNYQLAVFDLDGTILDTLEDLFISVNYALRKQDFPERSLSEIRQFVGNGIRKLIERAVPADASQEAVNQVHKDFTEYYARHCADHTAPYQGITELIQKLRNAGIKTAVVSNKADYAVQILCRDYFPDMFDIVAGEKEGIPKKPAPDAVQAILDILHFTQEQAVYIGDSEVDIQTAKNTGLDCISVAWGFRDEAFLTEHHAKLIVSDPISLEHLILQK